jgi:hypothetical protein
VPASAAARWQRNRLPDREHTQVPVAPEGGGIVLGLANQPPALPNRLPGLRRRNDEDAMTSHRQLRRGAGDELVDLVAFPPGMGADLRDGQ